MLHESLVLFKQITSFCVTTSEYTLDMARNENDSDSDEGAAGSKGKGGKARRELPAGAVATLKAWLLSPEHFTHPYPTPQDQVMLMQQTGIDKKQLKNWFTNARRRIWKPMIKKQLERGEVIPTGTASGMAMPGVVPGVRVPPGPASVGMENVDNPHSAQAMQSNYQQAVQQQDQPQQYDSYGNPIYPQQAVSHPGAPKYQYGQQPDGASSSAPMATSGSIGSLPSMGSYSQGNISSSNMSKNDSHAVLMELFARDQDLVRQAAESARMKAAAAKGEQQPAPSKIGSSAKLAGVPSMNSWPHFSSISSLNNLGQMTGVRSIASFSGADLASQGNLNKMGNLAQVKSIESMGKNDSYAFLEVFFGDRGMSSTNLSAKQQDTTTGCRGIKREREEDNDVGLSLDGDESPSTSTLKQTVDNDAPRRAEGAPTPAPLPSPGNDGVVQQEGGTLKRAYDDALAARGLMSVSRSSERLSDLALPAKMQRTLSQEYLRQHKQQKVQGTTYGQYSYAPAPASTEQQPASEPSTQQYPGQHPEQIPPARVASYNGGTNSALSDPSTNSSVEVASTTKCALCQKTDVDTQLRPCGHMFHEMCLKPSLQTPMGQPRCPIDQLPMESALLAVPTDENLIQPSPPKQRAWNEPASAFQTADTSS
jgi:hypothetical protein